ncbi:Dynein light chain 1, cytoplasmic [Trichinella pseudospiralis]|uniref:Dynein light chain n=1 Tax=Trichinella pseudospiralis TaxID=6337 RepID=A0A0V1K9L1_TRIPS|nr:Dynein light chain 1, cytoplasmic [Trichinella pseudospiralis]KRZ14441.1 Dynein light chain 1, cytoplasmic [Trichinella pseudospiralis]KRZ43917.1 Dynein light chain 1, cytoplasmic [Trichinella pseudospiralis]
MASNEENSFMNWSVTDVTPEMQQSAIQLARQALKDSTDFNEVAQIIKRDFGKKWGSDWQCFVTDQFDWLPSSWKSEKKAFIFFGIKDIRFTIQAMQGKLYTLSHFLHNSLSSE